MYYLESHTENYYNISETVDIDYSTLSEEEIEKMKEEADVQREEDEALDVEMENDEMDDEEVLFNRDENY